MSSKLRRGPLASIAIIALMVASVVAYAGSVTYTYNGLNRLIHFNKGTPESPYTIITGTINHVH